MIIFQKEPLILTLDLQGLTNNSNEVCNEKHEDEEDIEMGRCLDGLKVKLGNSTGENGRPLFFNCHPFYAVSPLHDGFSSRPEIIEKFVSGESCCTNYTISFHYIPPDDMYLLNFFIYNHKVFGGLD